MTSERGQATVLLVGVAAAILVGAAILGAVARGVGARGDAQGAADVAALAAARYMRDAYPRVLSADAHLEREVYLAAAGRRARLTAARNGATAAEVTFPDARSSLVPMRVRVVTQRRYAARTLSASAEAELALGDIGPSSSTDGYSGPLAYRSGKPMRPDVAVAYDRMAAAARRDGIVLLVVSGYRTDAEQAALYAAHPDPKWVAPPGRSLHRLGTELDLGPASAYGWLAANAGRFHFVQRYSWEPWHYGFALNAGTSSVGYVASERTALPSFVPARYASAIGRASQRWNVGAALLGAQLYQESGFNPFAKSRAGAQGIAQFMPGTAAQYGLSDPYDAAGSIDAQAHLMRDLLRRFGSVPLALAAYNAGPARVAACGCVPPIPETQAYVTAILALLRGAGDPAGAAVAGLEVKLVA